MSISVKELHESACQLRQASFSVVPLRPGQKAPAVEWTPYQKRRASLSEINSWWLERTGQPYNVGIVCGQVSSNVVLDFDQTPGSTVEDLAAEAEAHFGQRFPETCRVLTASGGWHDHYKTSAAVRTSVLFRGKHGKIEIRGESSIAVMPPSHAPHKHIGGVIEKYSYARGLKHRIAWEDTWMARTRKDAGALEKPSIPERTAPASAEEVAHEVANVRPRLSNLARRILDDTLKTNDRSGLSYALACEAVRAGITDEHTIACLVMAAPCHQEKYGKRKGGWDAWTDACSCAHRALEECAAQSQKSTPAERTGNTGEPAPGERAGNQEKPTPPKFTVISMAEIDPRDAQFLIYPLLPRGEITDLSGNPGEGKSWVSLALVAGLTGSKICPLPYDHVAKTNARTLILTTEDDPHSVISRRLRDLGADCSLVHIMAKQTQLRNGEDGRCDYRNVEGITVADLEDAEPLIKREAPDLIIIDPFTLFACTKGDFDSNKNTQVRELLTRLKTITRELNCATLVVRHFRKQSAPKAIYRGAGSIDFIATARSALVVGTDKKTGRKALSQSKLNLDTHAPTMIFSLNNNDHPPFKWVGVSEEICADHLTDDTRASAAEAEEAETEQTLFEAATELLLETLNDGPVKASDLVKEAASLKISDRTLYNAKAALGIQTKRKGFGQGSYVVWFLPPAAKKRT